MSDVLKQAEAESRKLRRLVDRQDFEGAQRSVERYVDLIGAGVRGMAPDRAMIHLAEARDLVDWARRNLAAARARLQQLCSYSRAAAKTHTLHLDA